MIHLWVDEHAKIVLKRQEFALSGRLLRTTYYPRWDRIYSPAKCAEVWYPKEIRLYDELEAGKSTLLVIRDVDATPYRRTSSRRPGSSARAAESSQSGSRAVRGTTPYAVDVEAGCEPEAAAEHAGHLRAGETLTGADADSKRAGLKLQRAACRSAGRTHPSCAASRAFDSMMM